MALKPQTTKFLAEVLAKLPTEKRASVEALLTDPEAEAGLDLIGDGVLRQADYSRSMNELKQKETEADTHYANLTAWYEQKKADLAELDVLRTKVVPTVPDPSRPALAPAPDPAKYVNRDEFEQTLGQTERGAVTFFNLLNQLSLRHYQTFGEILDTTTLTNDKRLPSLGPTGLQVIYQDLYKDQLAGKAAEAKAAEEAKIRQSERELVLKEQAATVHPYPVGGHVESSALDALEAARTPGGQAPVFKTVDQMAAEYTALQQGRR